MWTRRAFFGRQSHHPAVRELKALRMNYSRSYKITDQSHWLARSLVEEDHHLLCQLLMNNPHPRRRSAGQCTPARVWWGPPTAKAKGKQLKTYWVFLGRLTFNVTDAQMCLTDTNSTSSTSSSTSDWGEDIYLRKHKIVTFKTRAGILKICVSVKWCTKVIAGPTDKCNFVIAIPYFGIKFDGLD